jgi:hypothetical protein
MAISGKIGAKAALDRLQRAEATKEMFRRLPRAKGAAPTGGISLIKIPFSGPIRPDERRLRLTVSEPSEIEDHLLRRNCQHFSQAKDTPFATNSLKQTFNWQGTGPNADDVLSGTFNPIPDTKSCSLYDVSSTSTQILKSCQRCLANLPPACPFSK